MDITSRSDIIEVIDEYKYTDDFEDYDESEQKNNIRCDQEYEIVNNEIRDRLILIIEQYRKIDNIFETVTLRTLLGSNYKRSKNFVNSDSELLKRLEPFVLDVLSFIEDYYDNPYVDVMYLSITSYSNLMFSLIF